MIDRKFWTKVDKSGDCWLWTASTGEHGYGQYRFDGRVMRAHRLSWQLVRGDIPDGMLVLHHCDNRRCVNPDHLYLGTYADNAKDREMRDRHPHAIKPIDHGTYAGYQLHKYRREEACQSCHEAHNAYMREWNANRKEAVR